MRRDDIEDRPNVGGDGSNPRGLVAVAVVVVLLLASVVTALRTRGPQPTNPDEARFQELRTALPGRGKVGYLSDFSATDHLAPYHLTQYSLAPVVVSPRPDQRTVVGDFSSLDAARAVIEKHDVQLVRDFGQGLLLLENPVVPDQSAGKGQYARPLPMTCIIDQIGDVKGPLGMPKIEVTLKDDLTVSGWAIDGIQHTVAARVDVVIDRVPYAALYGGERLDVADALQNPSYRFSGFEFRMPSSRLNLGSHTIAIRTLLADGKTYDQTDTLTFVIKAKG
jgi:hypothetical protein